ncbi:restriction endonuclease subunit S [Limosilactobacillus reuteri]|uniref:Type I restriction endonuclease S subunit domain protein n=1 Tax=Limosilactobacillus reuteri subsp. rodentium (strain DSM 17509 / CIP 109821 / 100-23) TaxID=349123 RepID=B3XQB4_LIMR1|nr:restriction endonuclease subunit S [Limosilactobacillus reuteri]EDX41715.1 type I restriction endonuclease S subunit domain protein [Limosilactobacillus reuteri subsp. rodentium]
MDKKPEKLVPEVRFKGFTDDWEQRKGKSIFYSKSNKDFPELTVLSATQDKGMIPRSSTGIDIKYEKKSLRGYKKIEPGDFVVHLRSFQGGFAYSDLTGIVSPAYTVFTFKQPEMFNNYFWKEKFTSYNFIQLLKKVTYGVRDGRSISYSDFLTLNEKFPVKVEQTKIADLFKIIDNLITLQQRKLEQLKLLEKALQQKLFPNSFQEKPLLRILHGDNSWWNNYIGEVFTERVDKGSSEKLLSVSITDGVYPFDESKRKNNSSDDKHNYKKVFQNDIAYNSMRLWQGALGVSKYEGIVSPAYTVLKPLPNQNSIFYEFMFKNIDMLHIFQRNSQGLTSDTWNLKFNQLQHIKIKTTNLNSQNKIAKLLIKIEELKNNESNYYHNLMTLKKYLLQKLFI